LAINMRRMRGVGLDVVEVEMMALLV